jgi:hypothetical protein
LAGIENGKLELVPVEGNTGVSFTTIRLLITGSAKLLPARVTVPPTLVIAGLNPEIDGAPLLLPRTKFRLLVTEPFAVVTEMGPVVAPEGTTAIIFACDTETIVAPTPLNEIVFSDWFEPKLAPEIVTLVPAGPDEGLKLKIAG